MKRLIFVSVVCAALLAPSLASGSPSEAASPQAKRGGFFVKFSFTRQKVTHFKFGEADANCAAGGPVTFNFGKPGLGPMRIKNREFAKTFPVQWSTNKRGGPNGSVRITGKFKNRFTKAVGTLRARGTFGGNTDCDTGQVDWIAQLVN
jgi:hypothetical protein